MFKSRQYGFYKLEYVEIRGKQQKMGKERKLTNSGPAVSFLN